MGRIDSFLRQKTHQSLIQPAASGFEAGCLTLFSLPFLAAGLFIMGLGLGPMLKRAQSAAWSPVSATVGHVELLESRTSKGGRTYEIEARYVYHWEGQQYVGSRVGLESGKSSDGVHRERYYELRAALGANRPVNAFVNPDNPREALLYRDLLPTTYLFIPFGFVFAVIGASLGGGSLWYWRKLRRVRQRAEADPERPWTHENLWPSFESRSMSAAGLLVYWLLTIVLNAVTGTIFRLLMASSNSVPWFVIAIIGAFFSATLALAGYTLYVTARYFKFGRARLLFPQLPLAPGGAYDCALILNQPLHGDAPVITKLRCVEALTTGSGKQRKTVKRNVFEATYELDRAMLDIFDRRIVLSIEIPEGFPDRTWQGNPTYTWELEVEAAEPGVDFYATFELPVFRVSSPALVQRRSAVLMA